MTKVVLLGPQGSSPTVRSTLDELELSGPIAVVTAGWEEREAEVDELATHVGREVCNLRLFTRAEAALERDPELATALRELNDRLRTLRIYYQLRLSNAMSAIRDLAERETPKHKQELDEEIEHALGAVHVLDQHHRQRSRDAFLSFDERMTPSHRDSIGRARGKIRKELSRCKTLAIAGGHVAVLLGRMRLFVLDELIEDQTIIAWSAGAMALTDQVVLFHDSPPQGRGDAEVLSEGLGLCPDVVALPHARQRLLLDDPLRVSIMARRFAPSRCLALDKGSRAIWNGTSWTVAPGTRTLQPDGSLHVGGIS
jgi:hypothetical protein